MTHDQFLDYWLNQHVPLAKELPGLRCYRTAVPVAPEHSQYDGIAELYFDTVDDFEAVLGADSETEAMRDVPNFERDSSRHLVTETVHVDELRDSSRHPKLVAVLTRERTLSHEAFGTRLRDRDPPVGPADGLQKYTTAVPVSPEEATYDGIVELYFDDQSSMTAALSPDDSPAGVRYPTGDSLTDRASTHVVEEIVQLDTRG